MRQFLFFLVTIHFTTAALCQKTLPTTLIPKPPIDSAAIVNWADLLWSEPVISPDGRYFMYPISNLPAGSKTLVIQSTQNSWKKEFIGAEPGIFSFDSKQAIFQSADTLFLVSPGTNKQDYITGVSRFTYPKTQMNSKSSNSGKLIAYKVELNSSLILRDLVKDKQFKIDSVTDFLLNESGDIVVLKKSNKQSGIERLEWFDLVHGLSKTIWSNDSVAGHFNVSSYRFNNAGRKIVFLTQDKNDVTNNLIWYYKPSMQEAEVKVSNEILKRNDGMILSNSAPSFNS